MFFGCLKKKMSAVVWDWQCQNKGTTLNKYTLIEEVYKIVEAMMEDNGSQLLVKGFERSGIYPWNSEKVISSRLKPSSVFRSPVHEAS